MEFPRLLHLGLAAGLWIATGIAIPPRAPSSPGLSAIRQAVAARHFRRAQAWLAVYLRRYPDSAPAWTLEGMLADAARDFARGSAAFLRARRLAPSAGAWTNWGNHLLLAGHPRQARAAWRQALTLAPDFLDARFNLIRELLLLPACRPAGPELTVVAHFPAPAAVPACAHRALQAWRGFPASAQHQPAIADLGVRALLANRHPAAALALARAAVAAQLVPAQPRLEAALGITFLRAGHPRAARALLRVALRAPARAWSQEPRLRLALAEADFYRALAVSPSPAAARAFARAAAGLAGLHRLRPGWWQPCYWLGRLAIAERHPMTAARWLLRAESAAPDQAPPYAALASSLMRQSFWQDAVSQWRHYLRLEPNDARAWRALAAAEQMAEFRQPALADMRHYIQLRPHNPSGWYLLALMEQGQGELAAAHTDLHQALRVDPGFAPAWSTRAKLSLAANHLRRARREIGRALAAQPDYAPALMHLGEWELRRGHPELALPLLQRAVRLAPQRVAAWYQLAQCYLRLHNRPQALAAETRFRALRRQRGQTGAGGLLAWLRADLRLSPAAQRRHYRAFLRQVIAAQPRNQRARCRLGIAYLQAGETARGLPWLRTALNSQLPRADAEAAGAALAAAGHWRLATAYEQAALARPAAAPLRVDAELAWARAALSAGRPDAALAVISRVPANARPRGAAADLAALIYARQGHNNRAWAAFRVALRLNPRRALFYRDAAVFLGSRHQWKPALAVIALGNQQCPNTVTLELERAILLQLSGRRAEAQHELEALAAQPRQLPAWRWQALTLLAISYYTTDRKARAHSLLVRLTRDDPANASAWYYRALLDSEAGERRLALRRVRRSLRLAPRDANALYLAGQLEFGAGIWPQAHRDLRAAARLRPHWPQPHFLLSRLYFRLGQNAAAQREQQRFQQLTRTAPDWKTRELQSYLNGLASTR